MTGNTEVWKRLDKSVHCVFSVRSGTPPVDEGGEVLLGDAELAAEAVHPQVGIVDPASDGLGGDLQNLGHILDGQQAR